LACRPRQRHLHHAVVHQHLHPQHIRNASKKRKLVETLHLDRHNQDDENVYARGRKPSSTLYDRTAASLLYAPVYDPLAA
jgi:hypothetical protein